LVFCNPARLSLFLCLVISFIAVMTMSARALDAIDVPVDMRAIDLTGAVDRYINAGERLQVSTAPGVDGIVRRIEVRARDENSPGHWSVMALSNPSDQQIDRLLVVPHFRLAGSKIIWPDLGGSRMVSITPSEGFAPVRLDNGEADVFQITLDPGAIVTFVIEQRTVELPQMYLWEPDAYQEMVTATTLYKGIVLGIAGLLALFLTILFIVKQSAMFPAIAGLAWTVLAYLSLEFGFVNRIFAIDPGQDQVLRAVVEICLSAALIVFLYAYLHLHRWHVRYSHVAGLALVSLGGLIAIAVIEPAVASGVARITLGFVGVVGILLILILALRGFDRAILLIPAWSLLLAWIACAWLTVAGHLVNDIVSSALAGGLVMIVLMLGFTVMQHAFVGAALMDGLMSDSERKILALSGSGDIVWDWDVMRDAITTTPYISNSLGLKSGALQGPALGWLDAMHLDDRDTFRATLDAMLDQKRGRLDLAFRLRNGEGIYRWFRLKARPVVGENGEVLRCVGILQDITEDKMAEERLMHNAIYDNLTGLPNSELFLDRLNIALQTVKHQKNMTPSVLVIELDHFANVMEQAGGPISDTILLTVSRRITRLLHQMDTLARLSHNRFGLLLLSEDEPVQVAKFAEAVRRALRPAILLGDKEIFLTASIGIAVFNKQMERAEDVVKDAEIAMKQAQKLGGDRTEVYKPALRRYGHDLQAVEHDLRKALDNEELVVLFQPVVELGKWSVVGFEALVRWDNPGKGRISPSEFIPIAEQSGLVIPLGLYVMERAAKTLSSWIRSGVAMDDLFVSVNVSSRQLLRNDLVNDIKAILTRYDLPPHTLKLEVTESLIMQNPEYSSQVLERIRQLGVRLSLDDFGTGYSSLAYLQRFPFDTIKIDKAFIDGRHREKRSVILRTIIGLAHDLNMSVIAEGVEHESSSLELQQLNCEMAQGYLFGPPVEMHEAYAMLQDQVLQVAE
jgi:diguanylate cyclase (GGDEF)-like protein/PAS domain S-box-containing protein